MTGLVTHPAGIESDAVRGCPGRVSYQVGKRSIDLVIALTLLVLLSPVFAAVAVAIKLTSPGPVFFRQVRMGSHRRRRSAEWDLRPFVILKFRSMRADADQAAHREHIERFVKGTLEGGQANGFKIGSDPRITRVGRSIRRASIDELPQLLNVLKGEMSLVGPRPIPQYEVALQRSEHRRRFATRPGMTGLWQVSGRSLRTFDEMMLLDLEYVERQSLALDLRILLKTFPAVVRGEGAA